MNISGIISVLKKHKKYILISLLAFIVGVLVGLCTPVKVSERMVNDISKVLSLIVKVLKHNPLLCALLIFLKNSLTAVLTFILGPLAPLVVAYNGWLLGALAIYFNSKGMISTYILGILPHGVIEIPALIIAGASGLKLGHILIQKLKVKLGEVTSVNVVDVSVAIKMLILSLALFMIAAFIEALITPKILGLP